MLKDFLIVGVGSFFGGGMRLLVSKGIQALTVVSFPFGTFAVNILGCLLIGFLSGLPTQGLPMSASTKLLLTTGFCGGFTTFSTFMSENANLVKEDQFFYLALYIFASLAVGFLAVVAGHEMSKWV